MVRRTWRKKRSYSKKRSAVRRTGGYRKKSRKAKARSAPRVKGRTLLAGVTERKSKGSEILWVDYEQLTDRTIPVASAGPKIIWTTDSSILDEESKANLFNPNPNVGFGTDNTYTGTEWQYLSVDLRFLIVPWRATAFNNNIFRLMVVKNKTDGEVPNTNNMPTHFNEPIRGKIWEIIMDKTFAMNNGYSSADNDPPGTVSASRLNLRSKIKEFRMQIPYKVSAQITVPGNKFKSLKNIYVSIFMYNPCNDYVFANTYARVYFKDP